ncbi:MAG: hypothetical protein HY543_03870 [Deltaproteobacteria bacterium]|nr:hypothetical protein [Deltaproteobacteria bacterium]
MNTDGGAAITHTPIEGGNCSGWTYCQKNPDDPKCKQSDPTVDCATEPTHPACPPATPEGGFDCGLCLNNDYKAAHPECAQCVSTLDYCFDDDPTALLEKKGSVYLFPGTPAEKMAHDVCYGWDDAVKGFSAVVQVACGPNNTFFFSQPYACADASKPGVTLVCNDGMCVAK